MEGGVENAMLPPQLSRRIWKPFFSAPPLPPPFLTLIFLNLTPDPKVRFLSLNLSTFSHFHFAAHFTLLCCTLLCFTRFTSHGSNSTKATFAEAEKKISLVITSNVPSP